MAEPIVQDLACLDMLQQMLQTLNQVACDELLAQGHSLECSQALVEVANVSGKMYMFILEAQDAFTNRVIAGSNLHLVLEAETDED